MVNEIGIYTECVSLESINTCVLKLIVNLTGSSWLYKKIALCGLRWLKLYVSRFKRCEISNAQTFGQWRRFTKKIN